MDRKSLIVISVCFVFLLLWPKLVEKVFPPVEAPPTTNEVSETRIEGATNIENISSAEETPSTSISNAVEQLESLPGASAGPEKTVTLENERARFIFTSHGGGLKEIDLKRYERLPGRSKNDDGSVESVHLNENARFPIMSLVGDKLQGDGVFDLQKNGNRLTAVKTLTNGLRLVHDFQISTNYSIICTTRVENRGTNTITLPAIQRVIGTSTPINEKDQSIYNGMMWYDGKDKKKIGLSWFANRTLGCFPGTPRSLYQAGTNVVWAAAYNQFFTVIAKPDPPAKQVVAREIETPLLDKKGRPLKAIQTALIFPEVSVKPGEGAQQTYEIYTGPKEYKRLDNLSDHRDLVMGFNGFFGFFSKALLFGMNTLHGWGISYGWTIILITILIKFAFWPLTHASTKSMKRMSKLQPQMKAIQEKYKDNPQEMNKKLMKFMKDNKVSPLGGCLPMFLQMPVFIGFFMMIKTAIELRGAPFLWAWDLSQADTLFTIGGFPINPMPILMGVAMFYQAQMTPTAPGVDPVQAKMMKYMPMIFVVFLYNFSSGLTLYWTVSNVLTIIQTRITRIADEKKDQAAKVVKKDDRPKPVFSGKKKRKKKQ